MLVGRYKRFRLNENWRSFNNHLTTARIRPEVTHIDVNVYTTTMYATRLPVHSQGTFLKMPTCNIIAVFIKPSREMRYREDKGAESEQHRTDSKHPRSMSFVSVECDKEAKYEVANVVTDYDQSSLKTLQSKSTFQG